MKFINIYRERERERERIYNSKFAPLVFLIFSPQQQRLLLQSFTTLICNFPIVLCFRCLYACKTISQCLLLELYFLSFETTMTERSWLKMRGRKVIYATAASAAADCFALICFDCMEIAVRERGKLNVLDWRVQFIIIRASPPHDEFKTTNEFLFSRPRERNFTPI